MLSGRKRIKGCQGKTVFLGHLNGFKLKRMVRVLTSFDFSKVRFIDLRNNRLTRLTNGTLRGLQQAETVDLSGNKIASIQNEAFTGFHHLKELDLSHNKLKMIKNGAFRGCLTLHTIKLKNAGISLIQPNAFDDFVNLKTLDLSDNKLTIPDALFRLGTSPSLTSLILSGNDLSNITTGVWFKFL